MADMYSEARLIALQLFETLNVRGSDYPTVLDEAINLTLRLPPYSAIDRDRLRADLETSVNVTINHSRTLTDGTAHTPWLLQKKHQIKWRFWDRYRTFLLRERQLPPRVVERLDDISDEILGLVGDPSAPGTPFDRRGLVVGHVQSGKTTNYAALVNKALDAGYRLVVVLTGLHNSLRSQTQLRLDEEVLGFDTARSRLSSEDQGRFGVALMPGVEHLRIGSLTSWAEHGDFTISRATNIAVQPGGDTPLILVVKKNGTVLRNLVTYFRDQSPIAKADPDTGQLHVPDVPLLVVDDEADLASVNTGEIPEDDDGRPLDDYDPKKINQRIRELLNCFHQSVYVGYTATPFANVFIHPDAPHRLYGEDLFPRSFILALPAPDNYIGAHRLLGTDSDQNGQPVFRRAVDADTLVPPRHNKTFVPQALPESLKEALRAFLLSSAARRARGQVHVHNSMLVHVTRFTNVQREVAELVDAELQHLKQRLTWGDGADPSNLRSELEHLWYHDFASTSRAMGCVAPSWELVEPELEAAANLTKVRIINGTSADVLDYRQNAATGINVIAIGGDKLSRGLTLEGLTVSYFLRASKMYDTLMQMGRWFGYRPDYEDLCRIYTTTELQTWFGHIAAADEELRTEFDYMVSVGATPRDYGLRVLSHPVLTVTSRVKMRSGTVLQLSYAGAISETTVFDRDPAILDLNYNATTVFVRNLGPSQDARRLIWHDVPAAEVIVFLEAYRTHEDAPRADSRRLAEYIQKQNAQSTPELTGWTVALVTQAYRRDLQQVSLGGHNVVCIKRTPREPNEPTRFTIRRLLSPIDETLDLSEHEKERACQATLDALRRDNPEAHAERPSGPNIRAVRPPSRGLLLLYPLDPRPIQPPQIPIGIGLSFPVSESSVKVSYVVNRVWRDEEGF